MSTDPLPTDPTARFSEFRETIKAAQATSDPSPSAPLPTDCTVHRVLIDLCQACLDGVGSECHTPGCAAFLHSVDLPFHREQYEIITDDRCAGIQASREMDEAQTIKTRWMTMDNSDVFAFHKMKDGRHYCGEFFDEAGKWCACNGDSPQFYVGKKYRIVDVTEKALAASQAANKALREALDNLLNTSAVITPPDASYKEAFVDLQVRADYYEAAYEALHPKARTAPCSICLRDGDVSEHPAHNDLAGIAVICPKHGTVIQQRAALSSDQKGAGR